MPEYPHLKLLYKVQGKHKHRGGGGRRRPNQRTLYNLSNRDFHGRALLQSIETLNSIWQNIKSKKKELNSPLPNGNDIPVFLHIDTDVFPSVDVLEQWGITIISEEEGGYIIGASKDGFKAFEKNIREFLLEKGRHKNTAKGIWELMTGMGWRLDWILSDELKTIWGNIEDDSTYIIEIDVQCYVHNGKTFPEKADDDSEQKYDAKVEGYNNHELRIAIERDKLQMERETDIETYVRYYGGEVLGIWDEGADAICFKLKINGACIKDIVLNYQYLFRAKLSPEYSIGLMYREISTETDLDIVEPDPNAPRVCIIDSGIQEEHSLLSRAIDRDNSRSYVTNDTSTADYVRSGGHGTKVAGVVLYPCGISGTNSYKLESFIQNARILDQHNRISEREFEPTLMQKIVHDYYPTRIFNLSVAEHSAYKNTHMSSLGDSIDKLMHNNDVLFLISVGNLDTHNGSDDNPGIRELIAASNYPDYLTDERCRVTNPGISLFAITVGSISHTDYEDEDSRVIAGKNYVSPFSRVGSGLWGSIKPDVVEFGGDLLRNKNSNEITSSEHTTLELVNSTLYGSPAISQDSYGTSFSTPKVSYIASRLAAEHPEETALMYRALIIHSARLPEHCFSNPTYEDICNYGYGVPNLSRALNNTTNRITFIQNGSIGGKKADIYKLIIPQELRGERSNCRILVEVTLAYTANTRLTRKGTRSYLSTWLEWQSSRYNEDFDDFKDRTIKYLDNSNSIEITEDDAGSDNVVGETIQWCLRSNKAHATNNINRNNSTVQKSWAIIESHQFAEDFSLAVIGHTGWDKNLDNQVPYALCVSFENISTDQEINIYEIMSQVQISIELEVEQEIRG